MKRLTLAGCSKDGSRLLLISDDGTEFSLAVDDRLHAALRGEPGQRWAQIGQMEIQMESLLRPRDIQARIRAGASPEEVAAAAQTSVDQIMPYAGPVLAERAHIADRAQRSSLRRSHEPREPAPRTLQDAVAAVLRQHNVDPGRVDWDAWRREDGRWQLVADFETEERSGSAEFHFDLPGNFVLAANDEAAWLVADLAAPPVTDDSRGPAQEPASPRRLDLVRRPFDGVVDAPTDDSDEPPASVGDDAIALVHAETWETEMPLDAFFADKATDPSDDEPAQVAPDPVDLDDVTTQEVPAVRDAERLPRREVRKSRGRASVPSWDEIMFGGGPQE